MDNQNQFGSFGGISPDDMENIRAALERRGMGDQLPALLQQSGISATPAQQVPPDVQAATGGGAMPQPGAQMTPQQPVEAAAARETAVVEAGLPPSSPEAEIILKAMADRLKSDTKIRESQMTPQQPQPLAELGQNI